MKPKPSLGSMLGPGAEHGGIAGWCEAERLLSTPPPPPPEVPPESARVPRLALNASFPPVQMTSVARLLGAGEARSRRFGVMAAVGALLLLLVGWVNDGDGDVVQASSIDATMQQVKREVGDVVLDAMLAQTEQAAPAAVAPAHEEEHAAEGADEQDAEQADTASSRDRAETGNKASAKQVASGASAKDSASPRKGAFNRDAARNAIFGAAGSASACRQKGGPTGRGKASVTLGPSGSVVAVSVSGPFAGSKVGRCIARVFRSVRVPPFAGSPVTLSKSFHVR